MNMNRLKRTEGGKHVRYEILSLNGKKKAKLRLVHPGAQLPL